MAKITTWEIFEIFSKTLVDFLFWFSENIFEGQKTQAKILNLTKYQIIQKECK